MSRSQKIIIVVAAAVAVVVIVCTIVVVKVVADAKADQAYRDCMASFGFTPSSGLTEEELDGAIEAADYCLDHR